ncbi:hypothetical protein LTR62_005394 [Meristemomyces frigidus]|uniref:Uncharacterized protein n=1 Tax=Meristemomyces frigidus TaxID=1508187 RepID=A0AAN7TE03_9PEZI|nr:hypothetical protein LTR62_005394 [Meristemomyces frigidus]
MKIGAARVTDSSDVLLNDLDQNEPGPTVNRIVLYAATQTALLLGIDPTAVEKKRMDEDPKSSNPFTTPPSSPGTRTPPTRNPPRPPHLLHPSLTPASDKEKKSSSPPLSTANPLKNLRNSQPHPLVTP